MESSEPYGVLQGQVKGPIPGSGELPLARETVGSNELTEPCGVEIEDTGG